MTRTVVWLGVAALVGCAKADAPKAPEASAAAESYEKGTAAVPAGGSSAAHRTVVFVGTSLTAGLGLDPKDAFVSLVGRKADSAGLGYEMVNAGLSGETSAGALRRVAWVLSGPGDVIVVETGANDGLRGLDVDTTRANIDAILTKVKATKPKATVLLVQMEAPPNMGKSYTAAFHAMYAALAKKHGVALMPFLLDGVAGVSKLNQADGIHPNEEGSKRVAANVWRVLEPVLRAPAGS
jgi:acyl-CoA thioesterase-1